MRLLGLELRHEVVHLVGYLGLGRQALRRRPSYGGGDHPHAVDVLPGESGEVERQAVDGHVRPGVEPRVYQAATHDVRNGPIVARPQQVSVRGHHVQGHALHLVLGKPRIDPRVEHGAIQPVEVRAQLERLPSERARHVVDRIAPAKSPVEHGDDCLAFRYGVAVDVCYSLCVLSHACSLFGADSSDRSVRIDTYAGAIYTRTCARAFPQSYPIHARRTSARVSR